LTEEVIRFVSPSTAAGNGNSCRMPVDGLANGTGVDGGDISGAVNSPALAIFIGLASLRCTSGAGAEELSPLSTGLDRGMTRTGGVTLADGELPNGCVISLSLSGVLSSPIFGCAGAPCLASG